MLISHQSFHYQAVNHWSVCPHAPCACGEPGCTFAGSPPELVKTSMPRRTPGPWAVRVADACWRVRPRRGRPRRAHCAGAGVVRTSTRRSRNGAGDVVRWRSCRSEANQAVMIWSTDKHDASASRSPRVGFCSQRVRWTRPTDSRQRGADGAWLARTHRAPDAPLSSSDIDLHICTQDSSIHVNLFQSHHCLP